MNKKELALRAARYAVSQHKGTIYACDTGINEEEIAYHDVINILSEMIEELTQHDEIDN